MATVETQRDMIERVLFEGQDIRSVLPELPPNSTVFMTRNVPDDTTIITVVWKGLKKKAETHCLAVIPRGTNPRDFIVSEEAINALRVRVKLTQCL